MTYIGTIQGGVIVLDGGAALPEGTRVRVELAPGETESPDQTQVQTLGQRLLKFAGTVPGLPPDFAEHHDHYVHGTPRFSEVDGK